MASQDSALLDDPLVADGNATFRGGMFSATNPIDIPDESYAYAQNMDLDSFGKLVTRRRASSIFGNVATGVWESVTTTWNASTMTWGSTLSSAYPIDAAAFFSPSSGYADRIILAQNGQIYYGTETTPFTAISGATYTGSSVWFAQLGDRIYYADANSALRYINTSNANNTVTAGKVSSIRITTEGSGYTSVPTITFSSGGAAATAVLGYGGRVVSATVGTPSSGYSATTPPTISFTAAPAGGVTAQGIVNITQVPSKPSLLVSHVGRLFCVPPNAAGQLSSDTLLVSDILDGESWDLAGATLRIGGDNDPIVALHPWYDNFLLVFKQRSVWVVDCTARQNSTSWVDASSFVSDWTVKLINGSVGCVAARTVCSVGRDVYFLSADGVRSISNIEAGSQNTVGQPISTPVRDVVGSMNQSYISKCAATYYNNRYFLSLPTATATTNTKTLVYNVLFGVWSGVWTGWAPTQYVVTMFSGKPRLNWGDSNGNFWTWDDYTAVSSETDSQYRDDTSYYESYLTTQAYDMKDPAVDKLGYRVEFNLDNRVPSALTAYAYYDKDISGSFTALSTAISISASDRVRQRVFNLIPKGKFNAIQFKVGTLGGRLAINNVNVVGYSDTLKAEIA